MKKTFKKLLATILVVAIVFCSAPLSGLADIKLPDWLDFSVVSNAEEPATSGACGDNLTWIFDTATGTITISGTGKMENYGKAIVDNYPVYIEQPWVTYSEKIKNVIIEDGVSYIGNSAFAYCKSVTNIQIGKNVATIGEWAFYECTSLEKVTIPENVKNICLAAFAYCFNLCDVTLNYGLEVLGTATFGNCEKITTITLPDSVKTIGTDVFYKCYSLESIIIPKSVTSIGEYAFCYCESLTDVYYGGTKQDWDKIDIGEMNTELTTATIHFSQEMEHYCDFSILAYYETEHPHFAVYQCSECGLTQSSVYTGTLDTCEICNPPAIEKIQGDANGDGNITASDARLLLQVTAGLKSFTAEEIENTDMNDDGIISATDARYILQIVAGLRTI